MRRRLFFFGWRLQGESLCEEFHQFSFPGSERIVANPECMVRRRFASEK
jgi:hypothetical protein